MTTSSDTVLVTGGAGFLGQHIVKLLQEKADHVKEIKILDMKPYRNILDYKQCKPIQTIIGNITDRDTVQRACNGVTSVYHVAGLISYGTRNVIDGCVKAGVQRLIYCSTVDVAIGYDPIRDGNENNTPPPKRFLFPGYPETKYKAECLVLQSNGRTCTLGRKLETLALRVNVLYGEGDPYYVTTGLKRAYKANGTLYRVGNGQAKFQQAYAGNAAWAFICADKALRNNLTPGGTVYYIPDDTPIQNTFDFFQPFLESRQLRLSKWRIPFCLAYGGLYLFEVFLHLISPLKKIYFHEASCSVWYICTDLYFKSEKARKILGYKPLTSPNEAISRSLKYYQKIKLDTDETKHL
ncbi:hypothetical protein KUTeg_009795, partial [Tegillarca granosa]